jgi:hypothetical protein
MRPLPRSGTVVAASVAFWPMSTRGLILAALLTGMAILVAFTLQLTVAR